MHHIFASAWCARGVFGMLIPNKHINNCKNTLNENFKCCKKQKKPKKTPVMSLTSGWENARQAKYSLTASS